MSDQQTQKRGALVREQQRNVQVVKNQAKLTAAIEAAKKARNGTQRRSGKQAG